jgi:hypothetical protein
MLARIYGVCRLAARFHRRSEGSVLPLFALAAFPILGLMGASIDYGRAADVRAKLQAALDSAVLAGARDGTASWDQVALNVFDASADGLVATPTFVANGGGSYSGSVTLGVPTSVLAYMSIASISVSATSNALAPDPDMSCILSLDHGQGLSDVSMNFGGAPSISLSGCSLRSNTSLSCNGHSGGATASIAAGSAVGCSNPQSYATVIPDTIYARLASSINTVCGGSSGGVRWDVGSTRIPSGVQTVTRDTYTEYHVCGDLTLAGTGTLLGSSPSGDSAIVIENGALTLANNASVSTLRTVIILTGNSTGASAIDFPNGNGQRATLSLSPPLSANNPWQGVALYQDPRQTSNVNDRWGPGATFNVDGVVYLPYADVVMSGIAASNNYQCTKIVTNTFNTNGNVSLTFSQSLGNCNAIGMKQPNSTPLHLAQ